MNEKPRFEVQVTPHNTILIAQATADGSIVDIVSPEVAGQLLRALEGALTEIGIRRTQ